jgi:hypothetical protein
MKLSELFDPNRFYVNVKADLAIDAGYDEG